MDVELLKIWQKGLQAGREKILHKQQENDTTFKETLRWAKQEGAGKPSEEQSGAQLTLLNMYGKELERRSWQRRLK